MEIQQAKSISVHGLVERTAQYVVRRQPCPTEEDATTKEVVVYLVLGRSHQVFARVRNHNVK